MAGAKNFYSLIEEKETKTILSVLALILTVANVVRLMMRIFNDFLVLINDYIIKLKTYSRFFQISFFIVITFYLNVIRNE